MFSSNTSQVSNDAVYIEDVFSTWLYTGNGSTQTITNGIDLSGKGGLTWIKNRSDVKNNILVDTARGANNWIASNLTNAQASDATKVSSFLSTGFTVGSDSTVNLSTQLYASWTFRKQPKFFDVVTWSGDGVAGRQISHALGSVPGCIIVKRTSGVSDWNVWHRSISTGDLTSNTLIQLNTTAASGAAVNAIGAVSSTTFEIGSGSSYNGSGSTYVAYLFAHNAGGFGLTGTDNVISCGSFTTDASGNATVDLGYEPQWILWKDATNNDTVGWGIYDVMRGWNNTDAASRLLANSSAAESQNNTATPTARGFTISLPGASDTYIYIAIRRGPMKTPTSGTSVFKPVQYTTSPEGFITGFPVDFGIAGAKSGTDKWYWQSRLQGAVLLNSASTAAEVGSGSAKFDMMNGYGTGFSTSYWTDAFRRAPGFFDVVCYTGTGSARTVNHNLAAVPELMIVKRRDSTGFWAVYSAATGAANVLELQSSAASTSGSAWNSTAPTASVFTVGNTIATGASGGTYVAYLFASCPGVSKVGSYTGTGTTLQINCGFTGGARFVLIKRTDSTGDWYVWDSARGIVSGNDPYLLLNSTAAEVTSTDYIDPVSSGFEISSTAPAAINASGGTFIYLAIA